MTPGVCIHVGDLQCMQGITLCEGRAERWMLLSSQTSRRGPPGTRGGAIATLTRSGYTSCRGPPGTRGGVIATLTRSGYTSL